MEKKVLVLCVHSVVFSVCLVRAFCARRPGAAGGQGADCRDGDPPPRPRSDRAFALCNRLWCKPTPLTQNSELQKSKSQVVFLTNFVGYPAPSRLEAIQRVTLHGFRCGGVHLCDYRSCPAEVLCNLCPVHHIPCLKPEKFWNT